MLGILIILVFTVYLAFFFREKQVKKKKEKVDPKIDTQMKKLWSIAQDSMREKKPVRAEKALLTILKFDETNAAAYNRLGILYAKGQKFDEAIECFEIAQSLDNNPSSLHNAGLIYLETGAYEKAAMAFRQALEMEGDVPARFLALAKAEEKLGNRKAAIEALESAYDLDHTTATLRQILAIYESTGDAENATATIARIEAQIAENEAARKKKMIKKRPLGKRRVA
ncbi:tetratricopeptide repeat protein [Candidatus Saccharibacteria bacterium]|nr:tetratricopeptide repeat protein [Candidatus Saccharibacteria bacterium]